MNSKERFSDRVDDYVKYRPSYPKEALDYLYDTVGIRPESEVADIGAGTGIFTQLLLERGTGVIAVEPNSAMRGAAGRMLANYEKLRLVPGSAEETGLPDRSVDAIVSAQAFHWFDRAKARPEFRRILRPTGKVALIWNVRLEEGTPFREQYEQLLRTYGTDYVIVSQRNMVHEELRTFFEENTMQEARFVMQQQFDFEGLKGRLLSSSYAPKPGHPNHEPMIAALQSMFEKHNEDGQVTIDYETAIYWGQV
ncbi:class I SAM-dependent methyltransferase [Paenibacillus chartarius]|uniref:Class I SAM-dependent methyltransferase n=1 Tax=Paenibacillus chartarius TaxID=747481 RepID=A0ABV6DSD9_9BACL